MFETWIGMRVRERYSGWLGRIVGVLSAEVVQVAWDVPGYDGATVRVARVEVA